jgi:3-phenylpropionate/trans-cinnamate dioxygenase ferredoxin subunit
MANKLDYTKLSEDELEFVAVANVSEVPLNQRLFVDIDIYPIVILNIAGKLYAVEDTCSHDGNPLGEGELEDHQIVCPRHGAKFDVRTGDACSMPATEDISVFPVRIIEDQIEVGLPKKI